MFLADTLTNLVAGLGTDKDKLSFGGFAAPVMGAPELDAMYGGDWIAGRVVDAPPEDETRVWRAWQAGPRQITALEAAEATLNVRAKVRQARKAARLYGGALIYLGTNDADPAKPLVLDRIKAGGLRYLHVFSRHDIIAGENETDAFSPRFGEPAHYELLGKDGLVRIHPSRVVRFGGSAALSRQSDGTWGASILQRMRDAILHAATSSAATASLTTEAKVDVFGVPDLTKNAHNPAWRAQMLQRFALANLGKSLNNALIRDANEIWEQKQISFATLPDVVRLFLDIVAGAASIPVSRLMGRAPTGLNSSQAGDAETRAYYDLIKAGQENELAPALAPLDEALIRSALGARPAGIHYNWRSLWQSTEREAAEIAKMHADAVQVYARGAFLPPSALRAGVRNMLIEGGTMPGLEEALAVADAAKEKPEAIMVAAAPPEPAKKSEPAA